MNHSFSRSPIYTARRPGPGKFGNIGRLVPKTSAGFKCSCTSISHAHACSYYAHILLIMSNIMLQYAHILLMKFLFLMHMHAHIMLMQVNFSFYANMLMHAAAGSCSAISHFMMHAHKWSISMQFPRLMQYAHYVKYMSK